MLTKLFDWLHRLFDSEPVHLAIVRRYADANGHYVGELYKYDTFAGIGQYRMIGASLDAFSLDLDGVSLADEPDALDLTHDFLAPVDANTFRVGALEPQDNERVRQIVARLPRKNIRLVIKNGFIEHVLDGKKI